MKKKNNAQNTIVKTLLLSATTKRDDTTITGRENEEIPKQFRANAKHKLRARVRCA